MTMLLMYHSLSNSRDAEIIALMSTLYYGFLRISEGVNLRLNDVNFEQDTLTLCIRSSKIDQFGKSELVIIKNSQMQYSPFCWLKQHIVSIIKNMLKERLYSHVAFFCRAKECNTFILFVFHMKNLETWNYDQKGHSNSICVVATHY